MSDDSGIIGSDPAHAPDQADGDRRALRGVVIVVASLIVVTVVGVALVLSFVGAEREREIQNWQVRLGIVADGRAGAVAQWLDEQTTVLARLSSNASLQLYAMDLVADTAGDVNQIEGNFVRNLLNATADQAGFVPTRRTGRVDANIEAPASAGLAIVNPAGGVIVGSDFMPELPGRFGPMLATASEGRTAVFGPQMGPTGEPLLGFAAPLYAIQQNATAGGEIGFVVGLRPFDRTIFELLVQPGNIWETTETLLVRRRDRSIEYITPLSDGTPPMGKSLSIETPRLAAAQAFKDPGLFGFGRNHAGKSVLYTSRAVPGTDWLLVHSITEEEALAASEARLTSLLIVFLLLIGGVLVGALALWRHGTSVRLAKIAASHRIASDRLQSFMKFVRVVTDGQPTAIAAVDESGRYTFANIGAAWGSGLTPDQVVGRTMTDVMGPHAANLFKDLNARAFLTNEPVSEVQALERDGAERMIKSDHIPLAADRDHPRSVLMVLEDITDLMAERAQREATMRDLVGTLVSLVDRRDPYSANHSNRVAELSVAIATEMGEPEQTVRTVDITGNLMNLGKILVPESILTKTESLTEDEKKVIRDSMVQTAELLRSVHFDLPVAETIRQLQERPDGTGYPQGLSGDDLLLTARIVTVANAFVGMVSPRAFRGALSVEDACSQLLGNVDTQYDVRPVAALMNYLQNRGGAERWRHIDDTPAD
ncbi:HD domain-containing phosphohydrolase [Rhodospira trueperi]|uniref:PAS domain S-box-containing protein n=1 Tax=Rhodospira trueperi TaxID=69960 RepID=A0A1G7FU24_9PROT|nr:HD domain-containing phosphohydrolase [Rhodospira trueperi]SDE79417.1 PAS domain S-box-containing protein [Rhodospira trueperi]